MILMHRKKIKLKITLFFILFLVGCGLSEKEKLTQQLVYYHGLTKEAIDKKDYELSCSNAKIEQSYAQKLADEENIKITNNIVSINCTAALASSLYKQASEAYNNNDYKKACSSSKTALAHVSAINNNNPPQGYVQKTATYCAAADAVVEAERVRDAGIAEAKEKRDARIAELNQRQQVQQKSTNLAPNGKPWANPNQIFGGGFDPRVNPEQAAIAPPPELKGGAETMNMIDLVNLVNRTHNNFQAVHCNRYEAERACASAGDIQRCIEIKCDIRR